MKLSFSTKEKITLGAVVIVLLLYLALLQFYLLSPIKSDLKAKQQTLQSEQKLLETLQKKTGNNETANENSTELQKEVPVKPLQDQFILDLQQAEAVSNSQIKSMSFTDGAQVAVAATQPTATSNTTQTQANSGTSQTNTNTSQTTNTSGGASQQQSAQTTSGTTGQQNTQNTNAAQTAASTPAVSKLTVQLSIQSPNYQDLEKFINSLEGLKRITVVEAINYTGTKEITSLTTDNKPLDYTLTVSAYYLPGLTDLEKQLPKVNFPEPANKENPLSQFATTDSQLP